MPAQRRWSAWVLGSQPMAAVVPQLAICRQARVSPVGVGFATGVHSLKLLTQHFGRNPFAIQGSP